MAREEHVNFTLKCDDSQSSKLSEHTEKMDLFKWRLKLNTNVALN